VEVKALIDYFVGDNEICEDIDISIADVLNKKY